MNPTYRKDEMSPTVHKAVAELTTVIIGAIKRPPPDGSRDLLELGVSIEHTIKDLVAQPEMTAPPTIQETDM